MTESTTPETAPDASTSEDTEGHVRAAFADGAGDSTEGFRSLGLPEGEEGFRARVADDDEDDTEGHIKMRG